ncbi:hypothetical protein QEG98_28220 [Myxococcus sp. MxC21-1]|uniref:hypothetical protein n=1 Tax=Myxococcus sp. MxC21-1 TaxID=3041439 RepID=UPI00292FF66D|nr:hypothetical protein [Myxococcus sp. MxC21-1]WNZ59892.1 hypothetical protein QEG98_28220 [Myxococcus sp. MxC21-1]
MSIEARIAELYREHGRLVVVPGFFVAEKLGSDAEVMDALRHLDEAGNLREYDVLTCPYRHVVAEGSPATVRQYVLHRCMRRDCPTNEDGADEEDEEYMNFVFPRFQITSLWKSRLDEAPQKKSPSSQN